MELFTLFLSEQTVRQIGWVLVHFLWQGCALMALMWCILKMLVKATSNMRYFIACAGLVLMTAAPIVTFFYLNEPAPTATVNIASQTPDAAALQPQEEIRTFALRIEKPEPPKKSLQAVVTEKLEAALPWCVLGWIAGVAALSLWYLGGWCQLQKLRRIGTRSVSEEILAETSRLARNLGISRAVTIAESALVQVPTLIGWLKPVILMPASALTGLDELQLRAMIAHELAHIKRCDYTVNVIQTVVEILGFYHPAIWWMSKQIRIERENCCDDTAVELMQDRKEYAKALYSMEAIRTRQLALALGAGGGSLTDRIVRLIGKNETQSPKSGWIPSVLVLALISAIVIPTAFALSNSNLDNMEDMAARKLQMQEWVEDFFKHNYHDISSRQTLEWGEPNQDSNGNYSIRYKYEAVIWEKDKIISDELFTFSETGKFISVKKLNMEKLVEDIDMSNIHVYQVNRSVSEFSKAEDFSTPESAYTAINRVMAANDYQGWLRVSTKSTAQRIMNTQTSATDPEWATVVLNARILEVRILGDRAMVIAQFPQELSTQKIVNPIDARNLKREDGKWLNAGEDRFDSVEQAAQKFGQITAKENETEIAYRTAVNKLDQFKTMAQELFDKLREADYEEILSYYDEQTGQWRQDGWQKLDLDYCVRTDWPSFALWVCRTFKDNPIVSVELGEPFISEKKNDGFNAPAIPYKLTLKDGGILQGKLSFVYRASSDNWQPTEGIDWHLQKEAMGGGMGEPGNGITSETSSKLKVIDLQLEPVAQGKNVIYATVKNDSDKEQVFAIHIYTRSPDYGPEGVGWGRQFFETLKANETRRLRFVYNIQGPVTEKTYVRLNYYNPASEADYDYKKPFTSQTYHSNSLQQRTPEKQDAVTEQVAKAVAGTFMEFQQAVHEKNYDNAWATLTEDHQKVQYHKGLETFKKQMEPVHPLDSAFLWEKADLLELKPAWAYAVNGKVKLRAVADGQRWIIDFVQVNNRWKIDWIGGYSPAVIKPLAPETDENVSVRTAERIGDAEKLNELGVQLLAWAIERNDRFPQSLEDIQWHDPGLKEWAIAHVKYVGANERADVANADQKVIAWDKLMPETQNGTNVLFADHHVEYLTDEELNTLLQKQGIGGFGGEIMGGKGDRSGGVAPLPDSINEKDQIAIEARFIMADESLREEMKLKQEPSGKVIEGLANSDEIKAAMETKPLTERRLPIIDNEPPMESGLHMIDSKTEQLIIRSAQQFKNSKMLSAPKAMALNNEAVSMQVTKTHSYIDLTNEKKDVDAGLLLDILPVLQDDNKAILLKTHIQLTDILGNQTQTSNGKDYEIPLVQVTDIEFQATVESGKTMVVLGPELTVKEEGTGQTQKQRLYVLLKPTAITPEENK